MFSVLKKQISHLQNVCLIIPRFPVALLDSMEDIVEVKNFEPEKVFWLLFLLFLQRRQIIVK